MDTKTPFPTLHSASQDKILADRHQVLGLKTTTTVFVKQTTEISNFWSMHRRNSKWVIQPLPDGIPSELSLLERNTFS